LVEPSNDTKADEFPKELRPSGRGDRAKMMRWLFDDAKLVGFGNRRAKRRESPVWKTPLTRVSLDSGELSTIFTAL